MTMPASGFFAEGDRDTPLVQMGPSNTNPVRLDNNALQIALELTLLQLNAGNAKNGGDMPQNGDMDFLNDDKKKGGSQNMTECVPVPSSEHVAEIVGRQGCKIKALRAKTNTYIKTPVRGEEPVFVVTGRSEDVANAKIEIMSAADHFSQIRACRKNNTNGSMAPGPPNVPGQITYEVKVPYRVVGLVVGPKGATIKRIQQQTQTYIVTPSREKDPIFEVTGLPENVCLARKEIEAHIAMRTGAENNFGPGYEDVAAALAIVQRNENQPLDNFINSDFLSNLCKYNDVTSTNSMNVGLPNGNGLNGSSLHYGNNMSGTNTSLSNGLHNINSVGQIGNDISMNGLHSLNGYGQDLNNYSNGDTSIYSNSRSIDLLPPIGSNIHKQLGGLRLNNGLYSSDEASINNDHDSFARNGTSIWSDAGKSLGTPLGLGVSTGRGFSSTIGSFAKPSFTSGCNSERVSPDFEIHTPATRSSSDPNCLRNTLTGFTYPPIDASRSPSTQSLSSSPELAAAENNEQTCIVCRKSQVVAALIPCGHNLFCLDCANNMVTDKTKCKSPVCDQIPTDSIRILRTTNKV